MCIEKTLTFAIPACPKLLTEVSVHAFLSLLMRCSTKFQDEFVDSHAFDGNVFRKMWTGKQWNPFTWSKVEVQ
jgi:hypothetical protein